MSGRFGEPYLWLVAPIGDELKQRDCVLVFSTEDAALKFARERADRLHDFVVYKCAEAWTVRMPEPVCERAGRGEGASP